MAVYKVINDGRTGSDYIIQDFNRTALELENKTKKQVVGKSLKDLRPEIDSYGLIDIFRKVWKTGTPEFFPAKVYADNNFCNYYENRVFRLSNDRIVAVYDDVTEREEAVSKIKESQERFDFAMNASRDGLFDWNLLTNEIYYSPGWKKILGYEYDEVPNDFSIWERNTKPEDVKKSWEMQQKLINREIDRFEIEFKMRHKEGHWVDILSRAEAVFDEEGNAVRMIGTHVDISQRKKIEYDLKNSIKEKEVLLRELYHRTKNNMQIISSMISLKSIHIKNPEQIEIFKDIQNKILSMALVHKKLYDSGDFSHIDLKDYLEDLVPQLKESLVGDSDRKIDIILKSGRVLAVLDIAVPFGIIVNEIITNSIKYASSENRKVEILIRLSLTSENEIALDISDNGPGFPSGFMIDKSGGFGLKTVKKIVETQLKGQISLKNSNGAKFEFIIPNKYERDTF